MINQKKLYLSRTPCTSKYTHDANLSIHTNTFVTRKRTNPRDYKIRSYLSNAIACRAMFAYYLISN